jgi:hypothetical protein
VTVWIELSGSGQGPVVGFCEHGNEPSDSTTGEEYLEQMGNCTSQEICSMEVLSYITQV